MPLVSGDKLIGLIALFTVKVQSAARYTGDLLGAIGSTIGNSITAAIAYQKLDEAGKHKSQLLDLVPDVPYSLAATGGFVFLSPHIENISGYKVKEFLRNPSLWLGLIHPDDKQILLNRTVRLNEIQEKYTVEYRLLPRGKAEYRWLRDTIEVRKNVASPALLAGIKPDAGKAAVEHAAGEHAKDGETGP